MVVGVLVLASVFGVLRIEWLNLLEEEIKENIEIFGITLFFTILLDLIRKLIKFYFEIDDIKLSPWDIISNDYAMIT